MLEHAKIDMRLKGLVGKLQPFEMPSFFLKFVMVQKSSSGRHNKANIFLGFIEYELNSLLGASHLLDYISVHIRFDLERYLPNMLNNDL